MREMAREEGRCCHGCIDSLPLRRVGVSARSPSSFGPGDTRLLLVPLPDHLFSSSPLSRSLSRFTDLFRLSLTAPDIFTALCRRVDLVCITPLLRRAPACAGSPSKTVSPPRFMFPPTQRRIDPFLLSDVYTCVRRRPTPPTLPPLCSPPHARARYGTHESPAHDRPSPLVTQSVDGLLVPVPPFLPRFPRSSLPRLSFETSFQRLLSSSPPQPLPSCPAFLTLTALYRLVTSVSRAGDLRASAPRTAD